MSPRLRLGCRDPGKPTPDSSSVVSSVVSEGLQTGRVTPYPPSPPLFSFGLFSGSLSRLSVSTLDDAPKRVKCRREARSHKSRQFTLSLRDGVSWRLSLSYVTFQVSL